MHCCVKAEESIQDEIEVAKVCKRRTDHLKENDTPVAMLFSEWRKRRLDRMLVEQFLRAGYYNTALRLAQHSGVEVNYFICLLIYFIVLPDQLKIVCEQHFANTSI